MELVCSGMRAWEKTAEGGDLFSRTRPVFLVKEKVKTILSRGFHGLESFESLHYLSVPEGEGVSKLSLS